jgi:hypothetical protein
MENFSNSVSKLKREFVRAYKGNSHTTEILPNSHNDSIQIKKYHLSLLHEFLNANPIYTKQISERILNCDYTIFEGDLSNYWIDSIKHDTSYAPFYPTWMLSAWGLVNEAQKNGFQQIVDIGSGDGRIAYCGKVLGLDAISIEIDENLFTLQEEISSKTGIMFNPNLHDATIYDFDKISIKKTAFVIGGVPEIGEMLAESVIHNVLKNEYISNDSTFVLTGSYSKSRHSNDHIHYGWGKLIKKFKLRVISTMSLPTYWTMDQKFETPYIFTKKG